MTQGDLYFVLLVSGFLIISMWLCCTVLLYLHVVICKCDQLHIS